MKQNLIPAAAKGGRRNETPHIVFFLSVLCAPVIMLQTLGWEKLINERLLAFFTFEGIATVQLLVLLRIMIMTKKRL